MNVRSAVARGPTEFDDTEEHEQPKNPNLERQGKAFTEGLYDPALGETARSWSRNRS
jgi:hypothetical protein